MSRLTRSELADILSGIPLNGYPNRVKVATVISRTPATTVAERAGLSRAVLSAIALGHQSPTDAQREAIAKAIGVPAPILFPEAA